MNGLCGRFDRIGVETCSVKQGFGLCHAHGRFTNPHYGDPDVTRRAA